MAGTTVPCVNYERCGNEVDLHRRGVIVEMTGFAPRERAGGGVHGLTARRETGRAMCDVCFLHVKAGMDIGQGSLL
jgi:hypothetical protein